MRRSALGSEGLGRQFDEDAEAILGRPLSQTELVMFTKYLITLQKWQKSQRLVGSTSRQWVIDNLFLDSLLFTKVRPIVGQRVADLGAGAGFPGLPLRIVSPTMSLTLIEARRRRTSFLNAVVRELDMADVEVAAERAEVLVARLGSVFDVVVFRCAGPLEEILGLARAFVRPGGLVVAAGPPQPRALSGVEWVSVERPGGGTRSFAVSRVPDRD